jgi:DNA-binding beta-propeller fold protein YncE
MIDLTRFRSGPLLILGLLVGCAGGPPSGRNSGNRTPVPVAVVVEEIVSGSVLGARLDDPVGIAIDSRGRIFVADSEHDRVVVLGPELKPLFAIGGFGRQEGLFDNPLYLSLGKNDDLWVADYGNRRICEFTDRHVVVDCIDLVDDDDPLLFGRPVALMVNAYGEVWVTDADNDQVVVLDNQGLFSETIGGASHSGGQLLDPAKIVPGPRGKMFVSDAGNARVMVYDDNGDFDREIADDALVEPVSVAVDDRGRLWVLDRGTGQIHCFVSGDRRVASFGPILAGESRPMSQPRDLAFDGNGRLLVTDTGNDRVLSCQIYFDQEQESK